MINMDPCCNVNVDDLISMQASTRKLLGLLEEIQTKIYSKDLHPSLSNNVTVTSNRNSYTDILTSVTNKIGENAFQKLEYQARHLDAIYVDADDDDCSPYKILTRKCHCLNRKEFNDFVIHFNEDVKYFTNNMGQIIKNMRILKKFLYMGGDYTRHALLFLNEGLQDAKHNEKIDIINGCSHADICNVFEEHSIVAICIRISHKVENFSDVLTQSLTSSFLRNLALVEEGRRYLNLSSKIEYDIKKTLRQKASKLEFDTLESLNDVLNLLRKSISEHANVTYYCKPPEKGMSSNIIDVILQYRQYMTLDELIKHLNLLNNLSGNQEYGKKELRSTLPILVNLFKTLLVEFDHSELNIVLINILNNIMSSSVITTAEIIPEKFQNIDTSTEGTKPAHGELQQYLYKSHMKKSNKLKSEIRFSNRQHHSKENSNSVIIVPLETKTIK